MHGLGACHLNDLPTVCQQSSFISLQILGSKLGKSLFQSPWCSTSPVPELVQPADKFRCGKSLWHGVRQGGSVALDLPGCKWGYPDQQKWRPPPNHEAGVVFRRLVLVCFYFRPLKTKMVETSANLGSRDAPVKMRCSAPASSIMGPAPR